MTSILDQEFTWAAQQLQQLGADSLISLSIDIATNQMVPSAPLGSQNFVTYAEGQLKYRPGPSPAFSSDTNAITRYFSDKRYSLPSSAPFNHNNTDTLTVSITRSSSGVYVITLRSSAKSMPFSPQAEDSSHVVHGVIDYDKGDIPAFITLSLCNREARKPVA